MAGRLNYKDMCCAGNGWCECHEESTEETGSGPSTKIDYSNEPRERFWTRPSWSNDMATCFEEPEDEDLSPQSIQDRVQAWKKQDEIDHTNQSLPLASPEEIWQWTEDAVDLLLGQRPMYSVNSEPGEWEELREDIDDAVQSRTGEVIGLDVDQELEEIMGSAGYKAWVKECCQRAEEPEQEDLYETGESNDQGAGASQKLFPLTDAQRTWFENRRGQPQTRTAYEIPPPTVRPLTTAETDWLDQLRAQRDGERVRIHDLLERATEDERGETPELVDRSEYVLANDWPIDDTIVSPDDIGIMFEREVYDNDLVDIDVGLGQADSDARSSRTWDNWFTALRNEYRPHLFRQNEDGDYVCSGETYTPLNDEEDDDDFGFGFGVVPYDTTGDYDIMDDPNLLVMPDYDNDTDISIYQVDAATGGDLDTNYGSDNDSDFGSESDGDPEYYYEDGNTMDYYRRSQIEIRHRLDYLDLALRTPELPGLQRQSSCLDLVYWV
ncbi:hypothetical protein [Salmon gill poxvirus]